MVNTTPILYLNRLYLNILCTKYIIKRVFAISFKKSCSCFVGVYASISNTQIKVVSYLPLRSCMFAGYVLLLRSKSQLVRQLACPYSILQGSVNEHGA